MHKCESCDGTGFYYMHVAPWDGPSEPCPDCHGLGHILDLREHVEYQLEQRAVDEAIQEPGL